MDTIENKDLNYWKKNAEEDYMQVPISVLRYISELEEVVKNCSIPAVVGQSEQLLAYTEWLKKEGLLNATVTKLIVKKYQSK